MGRRRLVLRQTMLLAAAAAAAGLLLVLEVRMAAGHVAGRREQAAADLVRDAMRRLTGDLSAAKSGMCIIQNFACKDSEARAIKSYSNINNQVGCDEKCSETDGCLWWTWYDSNDNHTNPYDCVLFSDCPTEDELCKYCYTGEVNCLGQSKPFGTLVMGGTSNEADFVRSIEAFVDGKGPYTNVMHDLPADLSSSEIVGSLVGDKLFVCGFDDEFAPVCYSHELPISFNKNWSNATVKPLTSSRRCAAAVAAYGELYVIGGYQVPDANGAMASPFIEVFNPAENEWRPITNHEIGGGQPKARAGHCAVRHRDGIYLIGGEPEDQPFISVDLLNITTNSWKNYPSVGEVANLKHLACTFYGDSTIVISGGLDGNVTQNGFWAWNIRTKVWTRLPDLNVARHSHVMEIFEDTISVAGGFDSNKEAVKSIEVYDEDVWTLNPLGSSLDTERGRFIRIQVSKYVIQIPS